MKSTQFSLKGRDWIKGIVMAVGTPVLYLLQEMIPNYNLNPLLQAGIAALITYLLKNFFTDDTQAAVKTIDEAGGTVLANGKKQEA